MSYILILGANSDIAKAIAHQYASHGYNLQLACREPSRLSGFVDDIKIRYQIEVSTLDFNILDTDKHQDFYNLLNQKPLGVISAIGNLGNTDIANNTIQQIQQTTDTNYTAVAQFLSLIATEFISEPRNNQFIIGISSVAGDRGRQSNYIYGAAKAAFSAFLSGLRNRLHSHDIQVLTVKPGFVATQMTAGMDLPAKLTAQPAQVAKAIFKAQQAGRNEIYTLPIWRLIMFIITHLPEFIFKRTSL